MMARVAVAGRGGIIFSCRRAFNMFAYIRPVTFFIRRAYASSAPSYWHQLGSEPLSVLTIGKLVDEAAEKWVDREALVSCHQKHRFTFKQIKENVDKIAASLLDIGLKPGDRLGLWGSSSSEWYLTALAASRAGIVLVCINPAYEEKELEYCLNKVGAKGLVASEHYRSKSCYSVLTSLAPELAVCQPGKLESDTLPDLNSVILMSEKKHMGVFSFHEILNNYSSSALTRVSELQDDVQPDNGCNIQFTSGTTGKPKAAVLSHHNIVNNSYLVGKRFQYNLKHNRICLQVPFFHCYGFCNGILAAMHHGATLVIPSENFDAKKSISAIETEKCNIVYGTPTMYVDLVAEAHSGSCRTLEMALSSGSLCSEHLFNQLKKKFNLQRVCSVFGLTETSPVMFQSLMSDTEEQMTSTVGHVSEHIEVKVVDTEGKMVPFGTPGELCVRGYLAMLGYLSDPIKTQEIIGADRWLRTGDQFVLREDGYGQVVGRLKDVIIRGGENIYPKEIEEFLETHNDILEAQVFGIPDVRLGEKVCACVRIRKTSTLNKESIKLYCKGKIAHFKIPQIIDIVDTFPKTVSGKIQKFKLKELLESKYEE